MKGATLRAAVYTSIFAVITLFLTYVLAVTIQNGSVGSTTGYKAEFTDATGLLTGDDVRMAGVRVGQVTGIKLVDHRYAEVSFGLMKSIPLESVATAQLRYRNLVGQRYLEIDEEPGVGTPLKGGSLIPLARTQPALDLTTLFNGFRPLFQALDPNDVNQVAYEVVRSLQGEGGTLDSLLGSTATLSTSIASQNNAIGSLISNLTDVLSTVNVRGTQLDTLIDQMQRLVSGIASDRVTIADSLGNVNLLTTSVTRFVQDVRPELPTDLSQLEGVAKALNTTTTNINGTTQNQLDEFLQRFPSKINTLTRTGSYGSWFNFYLCDADVALGTSALNVSIKNTNTAVCDNG